MPQLTQLSENMRSALFFTGALGAISLLVVGITIITSRKPAKKELGGSSSSWPESAKQSLIETELEIEAFEQSPAVWEKQYKTRWPGDGYAKTLRAQRRRLLRELGDLAPASPRQLKLNLGATRGADLPFSDRSLLDFAWRMKRIPRKAQRCQVYPDDVCAVVDQPHAKAIFKKLFPTASGSATYDALNILQERLDERAR